MARRPKGRFIDGIVLLDKSTGMSSNFALQRVKRFFNANKAGHTGALDPLATGMLPVCLGEGTKFSQHLLDADKRYLVTAKLGERTDTSDSDGEVVQTRAIDFTEAQLLTALDFFRGETQQVPSMYSALKYQGQPLYKYAREGIEVPRESRPITVFELNFIGLEGDELTLDIHCSKGTYIRTIIDDLGEMLGCGAHVIMLRRTQVAQYPYARMVTLEQLETLVAQAHEQQIDPSVLLDPLLLPMDTAVADFPEVNVPDAIAPYLMQGQAVRVPVNADLKTDELVRITLGDIRRFVGIGTMNEDGLLAPKRLIVIHDEPAETH
ncbi:MULTISPECIES: tRNA pseudouridine(55) synthase TruB [unclassified Shewanella]|jgi:tRNA pseudouridine55 synthase|uniref:tRNA pseudouridine(55) synthase TruB n=1 Tax=Shewanella TaxID=22 RepID=UPI000DE990BD|nr:MULTISPECIES: tRNA pseudouridine(55) synthase TruB [unclassified Shewanella]RBP81363.1 tRNA pseudouridine synthase B [Shewanella putrefaciens]MCU7986324.1 tRNA pseudouridine(55) synthase TruB [Shewanella sp. SW24]MCU7998208.1 tRNA pseudouridine(55) synthase TruB [Shewanella sp. SM95]MCU8006346.1 tRNA pseudouridine(55) synthase TruB [Shewanella sp. SM87]MCU8038087.1 tRNA pseudouridine(55) synthase TruB [Shewanella sp. SM69]